MGLPFFVEARGGTLENPEPFSLHRLSHIRAKEEFGGSHTKPTAGSYGKSVGKDSSGR